MHFYSRNDCNGKITLNWIAFLRHLNVVWMRMSNGKNVDYRSSEHKVVNFFKKVQVCDRVGPKCPTKYFNFESKYFVRKPITKQFCHWSRGSMPACSGTQYLSTCKYERWNFVAVCLLFIRIVQNLQQYFFYVRYSIAQIDWCCS